MTDIILTVREAACRARRMRGRVGAKTHAPVQGRDARGGSVDQKGSWRARLLRTQVLTPLALALTDQAW